MFADASHDNQGSSSGQATLPRSARLLKPTEFNRVFETNAGSPDACFRVIARPSRQPETRLGIAVSKKVDKKATARNRIKRVVRESFRLWRARVSPEDGRSMDIVVLARPASATICNRQLYRSLEQHWTRLSQAVDRKFPRNRQIEEN
jgi:ribonuclease P protein component